MAWCYRASERAGPSSAARVKLRRAACAPAHRAGLRLQDDARSCRDGYGRYVPTASDDPAARQRPPLSKRLGPKHWAALDYLVGALTALVLFVQVRHSMAPVELPLGPGVTHYWPTGLAGPAATLLVLAAGFAVALRRRHPAFMLGVVLVDAFLVSTLTVADTSALTYFVPVAFVLFLV